MIARRRYSALRPAAWLAVLAILLQALLPIAQSPAASKVPGGTIAGFDIAQNLCHAPGETTPDDQGRVPVDHQQCCDFCLAVHAIGGFAPPSAPAFAVSRKYGIVVPIEAALILPPARPGLRQQQPRPPPVFI
ncbi:MAG TPA: DUF2946 family protein [Alphaproteobacteria bacterium]|jgi:hypothetical protein|nr:DUF2946 family protein [Alphaproteobacteria bacterium]